MVEEPASSSAAPAAIYDVSLALQRLGEASPRTYSKVVNASNPVMSTTEGMTTYTWQYAEKSAQNAVAVGTIAITLDEAGSVVGVSDGR